MRYVAHVRNCAAVGVFCFALLLTTQRDASADTIYTFDSFPDRTPTVSTANTIASEFLGAEIGVAYGAETSTTAYWGVFGDGTMSFTVAPAAGYSLTVTGFSFDEMNGWLFGPSSFAVFTSFDAFTSPILAGMLMPAAPSFSHHAVPLLFSGLTGTFEVRIVATGEPPPVDGTQALSGWFVDNVALNAVASPAHPVPEPASLTLVLGGLAGALSRCKRRR